MYTLKQPSNDDDFKHYYHFRWRLLRKPWGQAEGSEVDQIEDDCFHIIVLDNKQLIAGIGRLQYNSNIEAQIRYMAVAPKHERQGVGRLIMQVLEQQAKKQKRRTVMLNARESAVGFYEKMGYRVQKKSYLLFNEIQHSRMLKIV